MTNTPVLELQKVCKDYPAQPDPLRVLCDIDLTVYPGETLAITGPSGCGKSTLLNLMGALDVPSTGRIFFDNQPLEALDARALARLRNTGIGFVFQRHHLLPQYTVMENVVLPSLAFQGATSAVYARADALLARMGLADRRDYRPGQLSGGECQRVAVARALINHPRVLLADEPTGSLNQEAADALVELLLEINREEGMALILVTHAQPLAERMRSVLALRNGQLAPRG